MVKLTADIQKTTELIDQDSYTPPVYRAFINNLHDTRMCVVKAFAQWQRSYGSKADPSVGRSVSSLEEATDTLIVRIKDFITKIPVTASPVPATRINQSIQPKERTPIASRAVAKNSISKTVKNQSETVTSKTVKNQSKTVKPSDSGVVRVKTVSARFKRPTSTNTEVIGNPEIEITKPPMMGSNTSMPIIPNRSSRVIGAPGAGAARAGAPGAARFLTPIVPSSYAQTLAAAPSVLTASGVGSKGGSAAQLSC